MSKFFQLHDSVNYRANNSSYYKGTWEPVIMERNRMIPFQVGASASDYFEAFQVIDGVETDISSKITTTLYTKSDGTFLRQYDGSKFASNLTAGRCYFKINGKYSEDCDVIAGDVKFGLQGSTVTDNLITEWNDDGTWDDFEVVNINTIDYASSSTPSSAETNAIAFTDNNRVTISVPLYDISGMTSPVFYLEGPSGNISLPFSYGINRSTIDITETGDYRLVVSSDGNTVEFHTGLISITSTEINSMDDDYSTEFIKLTISSPVDFGDTHYADGFKQVFWKRGTIERSKQADIEIIGDERNGVLVKEKITTATKYRMRLKVTESEFTALIEAMPAVWQVTDTTGKVYTCYNIEIDDPDWYHSNGVVTISFHDNIINYALNNNEL
jgi:hypothetical protein